MPNAYRLPRYLQIAERLTREIMAGRIEDGSRLPPERILAADMNVAIGTLRKSLSELEARGMLDRVQGSGNYVRSRGTPNSVYGMFRLERPEGGGLPSADVLSLDVCETPGSVEVFRAGTRIRRLRRLDDVPVAIEEIWLDRRAGILQREAISESLYLTYARVLNLRIVRAEDHVWTAPLPDWTPPQFAMARGDIAGYVERRSWSEPGAPIEVSRTWFDPQHARYVQRMTGETHWSNTSDTAS